MPNSFQPKNWRDVLPIHPAAELFPLMSEPELRQLGDDIKAQGGLLSPITVYRGKLLDGRNRLDALELVGLGIDWSVLDQKGGQKGGIFVHLSDDVDPCARRRTPMRRSDPFTSIQLRTSALG